MKVMVIMKANPDSEAGKLPSPALLEGMGKFNDELIKAGILLDAQGLHASSRGTRITFRPGAKPTVVDGPFAETKELIAGYWMLQVKSLEEAKAWLLRMPSYLPAEETEGGTASTVEIRQVFDPAEFGPEMETKIKAQIASNPNASASASAR
jgi:hypothetical protein